MSAVPSVWPRRRLGGDRISSRSLPDAVLVALACLAAFALSWDHLVVVWRTGTFFDTDDAMRMVQVRDWLAGQGWFDLVAHRLAPPDGMLMHWSRIVDVPLGLLVRLFGLVAVPETAERLARIAFPLGCQVLLILAFLRAARALCGDRALAPALVVVALSGFEFTQFVAGRVDHHAPQIVLLVTLIGAAVRGLRGAGPAEGLLCAGAMALSLGISLENLPFIAVAGAGLVIAWMVRGASLAPFIRAFGAALALAVPLVAFATVPVARLALVRNDSLSLPHILVAMIGGAGLALSARGTGERDTPRRRAIALAATGITALAVVFVACPGFPASPYAAIDPLVRRLWLQNVSEAMPLLESMRLHPAILFVVALPLAAGVVASICAVLMTEGRERDAWLLVGAAVLTGVVGTFWEIRVSSSTVPLVGLTGVWAILRFTRPSGTGLLCHPALRGVLVAVPFCPILCAFLPAPEQSEVVTAAQASAESCRDAAALRPLMSLPPGLAFAPIDFGAHLLAHTRLAVLGAPYHRNNAGNRAVLEGFTLPPDAAQARIAATDAAYVIICRGGAQLAVMAASAPAGLAARLAAGDAPTWLQPIPVEGTPFLVYRVQ